MTEGRARANEGDRYLVSRIQAGDEEAFRQLVDRFTGRLKAYAQRKLGRGSAEADDVIQETFLGLLENLHRLSGVRSLEAYLFTILKNKVIDVMRRSPRAHGIVSMPLGGGSDSRPGLDVPAAASPPSRRAQEEEAGRVRRKVLADILDETLGALKAEKNFRDLKILELLFFCGWRNKDAAAAVG
ncbi:MAG: RNA polymerase sigma factor, partial [Thermoanaerobaculia bacterium]